MPKATNPRDATKQRRHNPLEDDLTATGLLRNKTGKRKSRDGEDGERFVDAKQSRKILKIGQELTEEDREEGQAAQPNPAFDLTSRFGQDLEGGPVGLDDDDDDYIDGESAWGEEEEEVEEVELTPGDRELFSKFFPTRQDPLLEHGWDGPQGDEASAEESAGGTDLAALILERIAQHEAKEARIHGQGEDALNGPPDDVFEMHPKIVEVYTK